MEVLQHNHDVLAIAFRPDGKLLASSTLDGQIYFWNPQDAVVEVPHLSAHTHTSTHKRWSTAGRTLKIQADVL
jgi:WD40 repeat protein